MRNDAAPNGHTPDEPTRQILGSVGGHAIIPERARTFGRRATCLLFTISVHTAIGAFLVCQWSLAAYETAPEPPPIKMIDLAPLPPAPPEPEAQPVPKESTRQIARVDPVPPPPAVMVRPALPLDRIDAPALLPAPIQIRHDVLLLEEDTPPPLPSQEPTGEPTFEGLLLARLEQFRRYPPDARSQGTEGVVELRFRMNRNGRVLESSVVRGSGCPSLDREALATVRRAQPLPRIPDDRPDILEIAVPIEFFLKRTYKHFSDARQARRISIPASPR